MSRVVICVVNGTPLVISNAPALQLEVELECHHVTVVGQVTACRRTIEAKEGPGGLADTTQSQVKCKGTLLASYELTSFNATFDLLVKLHVYQFAGLGCDVGVEGFSLLDSDATP